MSEVTVRNFDNLPFTYGYLAEVVRSALNGRMTVRSGHHHPNGTRQYEHADDPLVMYGVWRTLDRRWGAPAAMDPDRIHRAIHRAVGAVGVVGTEETRYTALTPKTNVPEYGTLYFVNAEKEVPHC